MKDDKMNTKKENNYNINKLKNVINAQIDNDLA